jgi:epoxyqueuosine reductase QueG
VRNACVALGNAKIELGSEVHGRVVRLLERLAGSGDALIAEHALWALRRQRSGAETAR